MKIALCITGKLRNWRHAWPRIDKYLVQPLAPDIFFYGCSSCHGVDEDTQELRRLGVNNCYVYQDNANIQQYIAGSHNISKYMRHAAPTAAPDRMLGQYFNLLGGANLIRESGKEYDVVIRSRCDVFYHRTPSPEELNVASNGIVLTPGKWAFDWIFPGARSDAFALCNMQTFSQYASIYNYVDRYVNEGCLFHNESLMGHHLRSQGVSHLKCDQHFEFEYPAELQHIADQNRHNYEDK
jgi:hypothetical protein